jgi:hypothetical protein
MENMLRPTLPMHTLLLCNDVAFLGITRSVLNQLQVTPGMVNISAAAVAMIQAYDFDVIVVDWREIDNIAEFLTAVRLSKLTGLRAGRHCPAPAGSQAGVCRGRAPADSQACLGGPDRALLACRLFRDRSPPPETSP